MRRKQGRLAEECISSHHTQTCPGLFINFLTTYFIFVCVFTRTNIRLPDYFCCFFITLVLDLMFHAKMRRTCLFQQILANLSAVLLMAFSWENVPMCRLCRDRQLNKCVWVWAPSDGSLGRRYNGEMRDRADGTWEMTDATEVQCGAVRAEGRIWNKTGILGQTAE